jgi:hypothetical protein
MGADRLAAAGCHGIPPHRVSACPMAGVGMGRNISVCTYNDIVVYFLG